MKKSVTSFTVILILWQCVAMLINNSILLPYPFDVLREMLNQISQPQFLVFVGLTFLRILIAFLIALIISFILAILIRSFINLKVFINQMLTILRIVPTAAIILIALVWFSADISVILITLLVMIPLMTDTLVGQFNRIEKNYSDPMKLYGESSLDNILKVYIPLSLEGFLVLAKSTFLLGLKVVISSEVLVSIQQGLGRELQYARFDLNMNRLFATTGWIILIALIVSKIFDVLIENVRY